MREETKVMCTMSRSQRSLVLVLRGLNRGTGSVNPAGRCKGCRLQEGAARATEQEPPASDWLNLAGRVCIYDDGYGAQGTSQAAVPPRTQGLGTAPQLEVASTQTHGTTARPSSEWTRRGRHGAPVPMRVWGREVGPRQVHVRAGGTCARAAGGVSVHACGHTLVHKARVHTLPCCSTRGAVLVHVLAPSSLTSCFPSLGLPSIE